jgi:hypothetical protein
MLSSTPHGARHWGIPVELIVTEMRNVGKSAAEALDEVHRQQFLRAAKEAFPGTYTEPGEVFTAIAEETGEDEADLYEADFICEFCTFADPAAPDITLYEFWVFVVDSGTLFDAGSVEPNGIVMIQSCIEDERKTPEGMEIAAAAQRAYSQWNRSHG